MAAAGARRGPAARPRPRAPARPAAEAQAPAHRLGRARGHRGGADHEGLAPRLAALRRRRGRDLRRAAGRAEAAPDPRRARLQRPLRRRPPGGAQHDVRAGNGGPAVRPAPRRVRRLALPGPRLGGDDGTGPPAGAARHRGRADRPGGRGRPRAHRGRGRRRALARLRAERRGPPPRRGLPRGPVPAAGRGELPPLDAHQGRRVHGPRRPGGDHPAAARRGPGGGGRRRLRRPLQRPAGGARRDTEAGRRPGPAGEDGPARPRVRPGNLAWPPHAAAFVAQLETWAAAGR